MRGVEPTIEPFQKGGNAQLSITRRGEQVNVIGHQHDAIRVPFVQPAERFRDRCPSGAIRQRIATRHDAEGDEINYLAFPRKHYRDARRPSHKLKIAGRLCQTPAYLRNNGRRFTETPYKI